MPGQPEGVYDLDPLARTIDVQASSYKVGRVKIELELAKAQPGMKWKELEGTDEEANDPKVSTISSKLLLALKSETCWVMSDAFDVDTFPQHQTVCPVHMVTHLHRGRRSIGMLWQLRPSKRKKRAPSQMIRMRVVIEP